MTLWPTAGQKTNHCGRNLSNRLFDVILPSSKLFLLTFPRGCFFCGPFTLFLSCFCYAFVHVCLLMPCGHLLGKGWPLASRLWCLIVKLSLSHWYQESSVVLDCIDSRSLPFYLLCANRNLWQSNRMDWTVSHQIPMMTKNPLWVQRNHINL